MDSLEGSYLIELSVNKYLLDEMIIHNYQIVRRVYSTDNV